MERAGERGRREEGGKEVNGKGKEVEKRGQRQGS